MAASASDTAFITAEKSMSFRGAREHWVNVYHLDQVPPNASVWDSLANLIVAAEALFLDADVQFEWFYGHEPGNPPTLVWERDQNPPGEGGNSGAFVPGAGFLRAPGDVAMWIRYGTTQKSSRGKPIYLRNYYHGVWIDSVKDQILPAQLTQLAGYGAQWVTGFNVGGVTYRRAGPRGAVAQNHAQSTWTTTRTLKSRGARHRTVVEKKIYVPVTVPIPV